MKRKVTFGKFDGPLKDENPKDIFVDGAEVGWIQRVIEWEDTGTVSASYRGTVTGYIVELQDDEKQKLFNVAGDDVREKEFKTLKQATDAVRAVFEVQS